jgi:hypothetical protein
MTAKELTMKFTLICAAATLSLIAAAALAQTNSDQKDPLANPNDRKKSAWDNVGPRPQDAKQANAAASAPLGPKVVSTPVSRGPLPVPAPGPQTNGATANKPLPPSAPPQGNGSAGTPGPNTALPAGSTSSPPAGNQPSNAISLGTAATIMKGTIVSGSPRPSSGATTGK